MLIDCHVHLNNYYTEEGKHPRPTKENVDLLFQEMEAHGWTTRSSSRPTS